MKCHVCGLELIEGALFCGNCGAKVISVAAEPAPVEETVAPEVPAVESAPVEEIVAPEVPAVESAPVEEIVTPEEPNIAELFAEEPTVEVTPPAAAPVSDPAAPSCPATGQKWFPVQTAAHAPWL